MNEQILAGINVGQAIALIPARGGSKGIPGKNVRSVKGHPLIAYTIAAAKLSTEISRVIVTTDSLEIAEIAEHYGAEVPFLRPKAFARDDSPDIEFVEHALTWLYENEQKVPEYIVHLRPTTPARDYRLIDEAVQKIRRHSNATSLRSASVSKASPYKWFTASGEDEIYLTPFVQGMTCDDANQPRQTFPKVYIPNGYVDILKVDSIVKTGRMHGDCMLGIITNETSDIDTEADFKMLCDHMDCTDEFRTLWKFLQRHTEGE